MAGAKKHPILIVDDDKQTLEALERLFKKDYEVHVASSGTEGLKTLKDTPVSAIICDQRMPHMLGTEMLEKSIPLQPDAIRILITAYSDIEAVIAAINTGKIYHYETKPWDRDRLKNIVEKGIHSLEMARLVRDQNEKLKIINQELQAANEKLMELDRAKDQFLNLISHELRTPLTSILGFTETLISTPAHERKDFEKSLSHIQKSSHKLLKIIEKVILLTSLESKKYKIHKESLDLNAILKHIFDAHKKEIENKKIKVSLPSGNPKITGDSYLFHILFQELIDNTVKYNKEEGSIKLHFELEKDGIKIGIENTGENIPHKDIKNIFDKFRAAKDMKHHGGGLGLGLPLCQAIMEAHGGSISAHSASDSFIITLQLLVQA